MKRSFLSLLQNPPTEGSKPKATSEFEIVFRPSQIDVSGLDQNANLMAQLDFPPMLIATNTDFIDLCHLAEAITDILKSNGEFGFALTGGGTNFASALSRRFSSTAPDVEELEILMRHSGDKKTGKIVVNVKVISKGSSAASEVAVSNLAAVLKEKILTPAAILDQLRNKAGLKERILTPFVGTKPPALQPAR